MTFEELEELKRLLLQKKQEKEKLLNLMKKNESAAFSSFYSNELSNVDNHPADIASDLYEVEKNITLKADAKRTVNLIEKALEKIQNGTYGICKSCKKPICLERLRLIPYTEFCIECEKENEKFSSYRENTRPAEEKVMDKPFNDKFNAQSAEEEYEGVDMWSILEMHSTSNGPQDNVVTDSKNYYKKVNEIVDSVDEVDKISNNDKKRFLDD